jgi:hypothetical protein
LKKRKEKKKQFGLFRNFALIGKGFGDMSLRLRGRGFKCIVLIYSEHSEFDIVIRSIWKRKKFHPARSLRPVVQRCLVVHPEILIRPHFLERLEKSSN